MIKNLIENELFPRIGKPKEFVKMLEPNSYCIPEVFPIIEPLSFDNSLSLYQIPEKLKDNKFFAKDIKLITPKVLRNHSKQFYTGKQIFKIEENPMIGFRNRDTFILYQKYIFQEFKDSMKDEEFNEEEFKNLPILLSNSTLGILGRTPFLFIQSK